MTHSYLVCVRTAEDTRCKIRMRETFLLQKCSAQAEGLLSL